MSYNCIQLSRCTETDFSAAACFQKSFRTFLHKNMQLRERLKQRSGEVPRVTPCECLRKNNTWSMASLQKQEQALNICTKENRWCGERTGFRPLLSGTFEHYSSSHSCQIRIFISSYSNWCSAGHGEVDPPCHVSLLDLLLSSQLCTKVLTLHHDLASRTAQLKPRR